MISRIRSHLWMWAFSRRLFVCLFLMGTSNWSEKQEVAWSNQKIRRIRHRFLHVFFSCLSVSVHAARLLCPSLGCPYNIIQLSFYPQAMNNLWIVNQRRGVSSLDWSSTLMGPQGRGWRDTKKAPFHPLLVQIKLKALLKGSACAQVI